MAIEIHTVEIAPGAVPTYVDRILWGALLDQATPAGSGAGAAVTLNVTGLSNLPAHYGVVVNPQQDATWLVSGKSPSGFTVTLNPRLAANTLAAGAVDILIFA